LTDAKYLVDSDVVADALKGKPQAVQLLSTLDQDGLAISLITYGEIYEGILYSKDPKASERVFRGFLRDVTIVPITRQIMRRFAELRGQLRAAGNIISDFDLLIAATAIHHNLTLVTRNTQHFQRVPGLSLY
jgi:tRNA(fMet)-specific endonuclease VapC